jgi:hypothetical protein
VPRDTEHSIDGQASGRLYRLFQGIRWGSVRIARPGAPGSVDAGTAYPCGRAFGLPGGSWCSWGGCCLAAETLDGISTELDDLGQECPCSKVVFLAKFRQLYHSLTSDSIYMAACDQCGKPALFTVAKHPLCVGCYSLPAADGECTGRGCERSTAPAPRA